MIHKYVMLLQTNILLVASTTTLAASVCLNSITQLDLNECLMIEYTSESARLRDLYERHLATLSGPQKLQFQAAQSKWEIARDANCDSEASVLSGGSAQSMVRANCLSNLTRERIKALELLSICNKDQSACENQQHK